MPYVPADAADRAFKSLLGDRRACRTRRRCAPHTRRRVARRRCPCCYRGHGVTSLRSLAGAERIAASDQASTAPSFTSPRNKRSVVPVWVTIRISRRGARLVALHGAL